MAFTWNLVTKNLTPTAAVTDKLKQKVAKLERHLVHFPADAVHLQILLERHPKKPQFKAGLTLRLPSNPLRGEKTAADPIPAFDHAFKALLREVTKLKSELRGEQAWKRKGRRAALAATKPLRSAAAPPPRTGVTLGIEQQMALFQEEQPRLLNYLQRQMTRLRLIQAIPDSAIEPQEIVDEVVRQVEGDAAAKPASLTYRAWFYQLARVELGRELKQWRANSRDTISLDDSTGLANRVAKEADYDAQEYASNDGPTADLIADSHNLPPDEVATRHELVDFLQRQSVGWPSQERSVFELHFLDGFDADEVAMLEKMKPQDVEMLVQKLQERLRGLIVQAQEIVIRRPATRAGSHGRRRPTGKIPAKT